MDGRCKDCEFYFSLTDSKGECRRYPPISTQRVRPFSQKTELVCDFTETQLYGWCGEFKEKE